VLCLNTVSLAMVATEFQDVVQSLLIFEPELRLTADSVLNHPAFTNNLQLIKGLIQWEHQFIGKPNCLPYTIKYPLTTSPTK